MRAAIALGAAAALVATAAAVAAPSPPASQPTGFDHAAHAAALSAAGQKSAPCGQCHATDRAGRLTGRPGHKACFGACHGAPPRRPRRGRPALESPAASDRRAVCETCHSPAALTKPRAALGTARASRARPSAQQSDFRLAMSHRTHNPTGADRCRDCHVAPGAQSAPARAHQRCVGCHGGAASPSDAPEPPITACQDCHIAREPGSRSPVTPRQAGGSLAASVRFSHQRHLERSGGCVPCHAGAAAAEGNAVPRPGKPSCRSCHDGSAAFSTVEPRCRACHTAPSDPPDRPALQRVPYSHARHALLGVGEPCAQCHELDAQGDPLAAARDHKACAQSACHADEFAAPKPVICGACHVGMAPWRPLHAEPPPRRARDFTVAFSHADHLAAGKPAAARDCGDCHGDGERAHLACSGESCHSGAGTASLDACKGCHRDAATATTRRPWSVAEQFSHDSHRTAPSGEALACEGCHGDVTSGPPRPPGKATCAPCHDGSAAFKMTGHGCARCHGRSPTAP